MKEINCVFVSGLLKINTSPFVLEETKKVSDQITNILDIHPLMGAEGNASFFVNFPKEAQSILVRDKIKIPCFTSVYVSVVGILEHKELENTIKELKSLDEALVKAGLHMDSFMSVCKLKDNNGITVDFISELIKDKL